MKEMDSNSEEPAVRAVGVSFVYPEPFPVRAVNEVSVVIPRGEFVAIVGRNGSGKTTFMKMLVGLLKPTGGTLSILGGDATRLSVVELAKRAGYVYQNPDRQIVMDEVRDEIALGPRNQRLEPDEIARRVALSAGALGLTDALHRNAFTLSRGMRQRLAIASILAMQPAIMLIDEPTTGQDPHGARSIMAILHEINDGGTTVVLITHDMELVARHAERVIAFYDGEIIADGGPDQVFGDPETLHITSVDVPPLAELTLAAFGRPCLTVVAALHLVHERENTHLVREL